MERLYYSLKDYYIEKYGTKVYKITIDAGFTCPNRDGTIGYGGCIYCDEQGSGRGQFKQNLSVKDQILKTKKILQKKYKAKKFALYFQAFSNTYAPVEQLKKIYEEGISCDEGDIVSLIIGTRPDCIDEEKLKLISSYYPRYEVWIEYGLQSIHQKTLEWINRGHTTKEYVKAITLTKKFPIKITTHIIIGLPNETYNDMMETINFIVNNKVDAMKIHSLYIHKNSRLAVVYHKKSFPLLTQNEYIKIIVDILEILPKDIIIARLTGETDRDNLIAPPWVLNKQKVIEGIKKLLAERRSH